MRVLLVEDDPTTSRSIELMLTHANLNVYATDLGEEGIDLAKLYDYDLILLDLDLPDMNGHDVLRQLRLARIETPILILSGSDDTENKLRGFGFGADDYLTKPFHREELVARIHAIIRRSKGHSQSVIETGQVAVNLDAKTVSVNDSPVHLTGKEYQMLELLSLRKGTTLTKEMFLNHLYGGMDEPELKIIDVIAQRGALRFDLFVMGDHIAWPVTKCGQRVGRKPQFRQSVNRALLRLSQGFRERTPSIGEKLQWPDAGNLCVELPQGSGGGIARVGKGFAAPFGLPRVQCREIGVAHIDFAAHLQQVRRVL